MSRHEGFEELCAAAAIGQATAEELSALSAHLAECPKCRKAYGSFLNIAAFEYATQKHEPELSRREANEVLGSDLFRERFFQRAADEGIVFSTGVIQPEHKARANAVPINFGIRTRISIRSAYRGAAAAGIAILMLATGYGLGRRYNRTYSLEIHPPPAPIVSIPRMPTGTGTKDQAEQLVARNRDLESAVARLRDDVRVNQGQLRRVETELAGASQQTEQLRAERDNESTLAQQLQKKLADSEALLGSSRSEVAKLQANAEEVRAASAADVFRVRQLTERLADAASALDRERQMLDAGRDVRELMAARNLHIVDVFDTDARGKTRPAFGRVFFTEGKSLIFYAYDLNDTHLAKANYDFHVWGKREGPDQNPKNLGIFYSDDKAQRRWVFKCDDSKVLSEIDAVFVTVEPPGDKTAHPKGQQLMYAYLRAQPNHP